jgi:hypothetical protein
MLELAQVALHDHTVVILAVGIIACGEVLFHGNEPLAGGLCRHSNSILPVVGCGNRMVSSL